MQVACAAWNVHQCGDGIDNDADGLADANDPQCLGPCDNSEELLSPAIVGSTQACIIDCYFDNDTGSGNDDCHWNHRCDPHEMPPNYYPEASSGSQCKYDKNAATPGTTATCAELQAVQSPTCHAVCDRITPNGCDCFGCCELPAGSSNYVWLGSTDANGIETCTLADGFDPDKCQPCEPVPACMNSCDTCELCPGKTTVPVGCNALSQCPQGGTPCGLPGQPCCPSGFYCITGCCRPIQCPPGGMPCGLPGQDPCPSGLYCITGCCQPVPP